MNQIKEGYMAIYVDISEEMIQNQRLKASIIGLFKMLFNAYE